MAPPPTGGADAPPPPRFSGAALRRPRGCAEAEEESCEATRRTTPSLLLPVKLVAGHPPPLGLVATLHLSSSSSATAVTATATCVHAAWRGATS